MNLFDLSMMFLLVGLIFYGFHQGVLRFLIKLAGMIIVIILLALFSGKITALVSELDGIPVRFAAPVAYFILFALGMVVVHIISELIYKVVHLTPMGVIDSSLGAAVGILKTTIIGGVIALMLSFAPAGTFFKKQYDTSNTAHSLHKILIETVPLVKKAVSPLYQKLKPGKNQPGFTPRNDSDNYI